MTFPATISSRSRWTFLFVMTLVWALRAFRPDWSLVPYAAGIGFGIDALLVFRKRGASWVRAGSIGLAVGVVAGVLVYLPPVIFPIR